jgi:Ca-activated chloride channel homolog
VRTRHVAPAWLAFLLVALTGGGTGIGAPSQGAPSAAPPEEQAPPIAPRLRLLTPPDGGYVSGPTEIEAAIEGVEPGSIQRLEFEVSGRVVASLTSPPWRIVHDFGAGFRAWRIRVVAHLADGATLEAIATTTYLLVNEEVGVRLVNVFATVTDRRGHYVTDLDQNEFILKEDGRPQSITHFRRDRLPLALLIVLDTSLSMEGKSIERARKAATDFVQALDPGDEVGVIAFSHEVHELAPLGPDRAAATAAIGRTRANGGTALYDAVAEAAARLREVTEERRRAVVLLSDGRDEAESGLTPGSVRTFEEALEDLLRADTILYAIGLGKNLEGQTDFYGRRSLKEVLSTLASESGGRAFFAGGAERLGGAYDEIAEELRRHYGLAYTPSNRRRDGTWRGIEVEVKRPGLTVTARRGYYAPLEGPLR